jgi:predicted DNA binding protein
MIEIEEMVGSTSKLLIHMPDKLWLGELGRMYPSFTFEILSFIPISQEPFIGTSLIKISGTHPSRLLLHLQNHPSLQSFFVMKETPTQITITTQTKDNYLLQALVHHQILVKLPVTLENGIATFNVHSSRENIDLFIEDLHKKGIKVELKIMGQYKEELLSSELTPRQLEIYKEAKDAGFYDTPRKITLTELAEQLNMAKSSLSGILQRVHKRLLGS